MQIFGKSEQVQTTGKNLFDVSKIDDVLEGSLSIKNNNGILIVTTNANNGAVNTRKTLKELCPGLINGSSYTLSAESTGSQKHIYLSNGGSWLFNASTTITQEKLDSLVYFYASGVSTTATIKNIQIELGDKATAYEPYTDGKPSPSPEYPQEITSAGDNGTLEVKIADSAEQSQRLIIQMPNGLPGIPVTSGGNYTDEVGQQWVCDEIDLAREVSIQRIEKHIFGNNDSFVINTALDEKLNRFSWREYQSKAKKETPIMCDIFKFSGFSELKQENSMYGAKNFSRCFIYVDKNIDSEEKFKALINGKKSFYVLETPIITPLSPEEIAAYKSLHTYSGTTVVANDSGAGMSLTYTVDTKKYVDKKIAAISAAMIGG